MKDMMRMSTLQRKQENDTQKFRKFPSVETKELYRARKARDGMPLKLFQ